MRCIVTGCGKPAHAIGLCDAHYKRLSRYGDPSIVKRPHRRPLPKGTKCWCGQPAVARWRGKGKPLCRKHYAKRQRKHERGRMNGVEKRTT